MNGGNLTIPTPDGPMDAWVARPEDGDPFPALVVVQEAFGVNAHIRDVCGRFAREGYVALAPEIFHRAGRGIQIPYDDVPSAMAQLGPLTNEGFERDLAASLASLRARPDVIATRVGIVGFCVGGFVAFLGACRLDPAATVSFYGGGIARERPNMAMRPLLAETPRISTPLLCEFGAEDKGITPADVEAIRRALDAIAAPHQVIVQPGAGHAFMCDMRPAYHAEAAARAWRETLDWLRRHLAGAPAGEPASR